MEKKQAKESLEQFEAQKMNRRAALASIGLKFGAAALAAFTVDDLARKAGEELQRRSNGNQAVDKVARELRSAGVASAAGIALNSCTTSDTGDYCRALQTNGYGSCMNCCYQLYTSGRCSPNTIVNVIFFEGSCNDGNKLEPSCRG